MIDVPDLAFFALLARHRSLAAASQELGVTPPAVSRRLAQLEKRLKVQLLNRTTRRLSLTPEGERYLEEGERILYEIEGLERSLSVSRDAPYGQLRINATFGFGRHNIAPAIADFASRYPDVEVILQLTDQPLDLTEHALDIGIRCGKPFESRLLCRKITTNRRILCAAPSYLNKRGIPLTPRDLQTHQCIVSRENAATFNNWHLSSGKQHELVKVRGQLSTNQGEIAMDWALAGHGILLRSELAVAPYLHTGELTQVMDGWEGPPANIHAVYHPHRPLAAKVQVFLDFLIDRFTDRKVDDSHMPPARRKTKST